MKTIDLYKSTINDKVMSLSVSKYHSDINECKIFNTKKFAFIGISLGNSFFNRERLELIIKAFSTNFQRVAILLVDELSIHNYRAMGYNDKKIKKKLKTNTNVAVNRINEAINKTNTIYKKDNIEFYKWADIEKFNGYHNALEQVIHLYETNCEFKTLLNQTTQEVIEKYLHEEFNDAFLEESKWYFLKEIAFVYCINDFFDEESVVNCYYQDFKFSREFVKNNYIETDNSKKQDFIIYHCSE